MPDDFRQNERMRRIFGQPQGIGPLIPEEQLRSPITEVSGSRMGIMPISKQGIQSLFDALRTTRQMDPSGFLETVKQYLIRYGREHGSSIAEGMIRRNEKK